jgi:hypothetical protein
MKLRVITTYAAGFESEVDLPIENEEDLKNYAWYVKWDILHYKRKDAPDSEWKEIDMNSMSGLSEAVDWKWPRASEIFTEDGVKLLSTADEEDA